MASHDDVLVAQATVAAGDLGDHVGSGVVPVLLAVHGAAVITRERHAGTGCEGNRIQVPDLLPVAGQPPPQAADRFLRIGPHDPVEDPGGDGEGQKVALGLERLLSPPAAAHVAGHRVFLVGLIQQDRGGAFLVRGADLGRVLRFGRQVHLRRGLVRRLGRHAAPPAARALKVGRVALQGQHDLAAHVHPGVFVQPLVRRRDAVAHEHYLGTHPGGGGGGADQREVPLEHVEGVSPDTECRDSTVEGVAADRNGLEVGAVLAGWFQTPLLEPGRDPFGRLLILRRAALAAHEVIGREIGDVTLDPVAVHPVGRFLRHDRGGGDDEQEQSQSRRHGSCAHSLPLGL